MIADEFVHFIGNAHIYEDHIDTLKLQIERTPMSFPKITLQNKHNSINDYDINDISWIEEYKHHPTLKNEKCLHSYNNIKIDILITNKLPIIIQ